MDFPWLCKSVAKGTHECCQVFIGHNVLKNSNSKFRFSLDIMKWKWSTWWARITATSCMYRPLHMIQQLGNLAAFVYLRGFSVTDVQKTAASGTQLGETNHSHKVSFNINVRIYRPVTRVFVSAHLNRVLFFSTKTQISQCLYPVWRHYSDILRIRNLLISMSVMVCVI